MNDRRKLQTSFINETYNNTFCIKPFTEICNSADGALKLCCQASDVIISAQQLNGRTLGDAFANSEEMQLVREQMRNGQPVVGCEECYKQEKTTETSPRIYHTSTIHSQTPDIVNKAYNENYIEVLSIDVKFGNKCNLACVMCRPGSSSLIGLEQRKTPMPKELDMGFGNDKPIHIEFSDDEFEHIKLLAPGLRRIKSTGGEPMLLPGFKKLLEFLVESGHSKHIEFVTVTNGTVASTQMLDLMSQFKLFKLQWSVDAVGDAYNYIRYPGNWSGLTKKHKRVMDAIRERGYSDTIKVDMTVAVSVLNIDQLGPIMRYATELSINGSVYYNTVVDPPMLQPGLATQKQVHNAISELLEAVPDYTKHWPANKVNECLGGFDDMLLDNQRDIHSDKELHQSLLTKMDLMTNYWERVRKLKVADYIKTYTVTLSQLENK